MFLNTEVFFHLLFEEKESSGQSLIQWPLKKEKGFHQKQCILAEIHLIVLILSLLHKLCPTSSADVYKDVISSSKILLFHSSIALM